MDKTEARAVIKEGLLREELHEDMVQILAEDYPLYVSVKKWVAEFMTEDDARSGRPKNSTTDDLIDATHFMVLDDRYLTV